MAKRKRRSGTKGKHCTRYKKVRVKGRGIQRRCANFAGGTSLAGPRRRRRRRK